MTYQIFVQNQFNNGYQATVIGLPDCVVEGQTEEEAVAKAEESLRQWLARGKVVTVKVDNGLPEHDAKPWWGHVVGAFADDPDFEEAMRLGREYRESLRPMPRSKPAKRAKSTKVGKG